MITMKLYDNEKNRNVSEYVATYCNHLIQLAHCISGMNPKSLSTICGALLHNPTPGTCEMMKASGLNWNQFPLQFVISHHKTGLQYKFIGDPAFYIADPLDRYQQSMKALSFILKMGNAHSLHDICMDTVAATLPEDDTDLQEYTYGVMWLGLPLNHSGAAVYLLSVLDTKTAWQHAHTVADTILPDSKEMHRVLTSLEPHCRLASVGIEGSSMKNGRVKLYWRVSGSASFHDFGIPLYTDDSVLRFIGTLLKEYFYTLSALTFSAGFNLATGKLTDIKIDVSNRIMNMNFYEAITFIQKAAQSLDFHNLSLERKLLSCSRNDVEVAFIGIGVDDDRQYRLHMYFY